MASGRSRRITENANAHPIKKKFKALSVTFDENNNIILGDLILSHGSHLKSVAPVIDSNVAGKFSNFSVGADFTRKLKSILKSSEQLRTDGSPVNNLENSVPTQEENEVLDVQENNCRRRGLNYVARNASEINLAQIKDDQRVDSNELNKLERYLARFGKLLMV